MILVFRVSLMKNGEEIVSVGGAMEPSAKNMGISASNSVLLDLARVRELLIHEMIYDVSIVRMTRFGSSF